MGGLLQAGGHSFKTLGCLFELCGGLSQGRVFLLQQLNAGFGFSLGLSYLGCRCLEYGVLLAEFFTMTTQSGKLTLYSLALDGQMFDIFEILPFLDAHLLDC